MVIHNPIAGSRDARRELDEAIEFLQGHGWDMVVRDTYGRGDATTYAREATVTGFDSVLVASGDGTLREAVDGLVGSNVSLGTLPIGHSNVWARQLGLPVWSPLKNHTLLACAEAALASKVKRIDVGRAADRHFLLWAGIGFDAQVTELMEGHVGIKRRLGTFGYVVALLVESLTLVGDRVTLTVDGNVYRNRIILIIVSNAQLYGRFLRLASLARLDDGQLDICVLKGQSTAGAFAHFGRILAQRHLDDPELEYHRGRRIRVESADPLPVQLDGDPNGYTPLDIEVVPRALNILVPPSAPLDLFHDSSTE